MSKPGSAAAGSGTRRGVGHANRQQSHLSSIRDDTTSPSAATDPPVVPSMVTTIGGIGRPAGVTSSTWGHQFLDRKKFFEKKCSDEKDDSIGEEAELRMLSSSRQDYTAPDRDSPLVSSPTPASSGSINSPNRRGNASPRLMSDETGQKEESQSSQSQSDEGDEFVTRQRVSSKQHRDTPKEEERYSDEKGGASTPGGSRFPSHTCILDGRTVHKELDQLNRHGWSDWGEEPREKATVPTSLCSSSDQDLLLRIDGLLKEKNRLDSSLKEMSERSQSLQRELAIQRKSFAKTQERSNDMAELLRSENSHLTKSLSLVEKERDQLSLEIKELQTQCDENGDQLVQVNKLYHEAQEHNQSIDSELSSVLKNRDKLKEQKTKLEGDLQESRKSKESLRATVLKLRDQNTSLEERVASLTRERSSLATDSGKRDAIERDLLSRLEASEKRIAELESECESVNEKLQKIDEERASLTDQLTLAESSKNTLKRQLEDTSKEKDSLTKKLASVSQRERSLQEHEATLLKEINASVNHFLSRYPSFKTPESSKAEKRKPGDPPTQLKGMLSLHKSALAELNRLEKERAKLNDSLASLKGQLKERDSALEEKEKLCSHLKDDLEKLRLETERRHSELMAEYRESVKNFELEREKAKEEMSELLQANETLEEDIEEVSNSYHTILEENKSIKQEMKEQEVSRQEQIGKLLAEKACLTAQFILNTERHSIATTFEPEKMSETIQSLTQERDSLKESIDETNLRLQEASVLLEETREERRKSSLETDKLKIQLMTEISLLKNQVSSLEKDKTLLEIQASSATSMGGSGSAFQPVPVPATATGATGATTGATVGGRKAQQEMMELQHKVTLLENENKRLNDIIHSSSSSLDTGNALRRQILEMRKKVYFLESEKKQLTEKVSTLHNSLKMMRESKDRLTHDRLRTLQEENTSLQDRIRNMEDMFTRKLMNADANTASTAKENDILRHKLNLVPESLKAVKSFSEAVEGLVSQTQRQEEELLNLKSSLSGSSSSLVPACDILERVLKTHSDIQELLSTRPLEEGAGRGSAVRGGASASGLPPVLQQLPPEYISSLQGPPPPMRSRSHSQSVGGATPTFVYQLREKLSQLYADNLSVSDLIKHVQETLGGRHVEVSAFQKDLSTFQNELKHCLRILEETHDSLLLLWQQELPPEQLNSIMVLKHQVETWQDKVIARDMALKDIDLQMKEDYEAHNRRFSLLKSQVLDLKEEVSTKSDALLAKDQYIHEIEERSLNAESELYKLRKEMECIMQEALNLPEGFQPQRHGGNVPELVRLQSEELHRLKTLLNEYVYEINQLQARVESVHRENTLLQHQGIEQERHHRQIRDELQTDRDYLRTLNFQLIEQQIKVEDAGDLLKKLKRSQESIREQRDVRHMGSELENLKLLVREKELQISELQHQLHTQQLDTLKVHHRPLTTPTGNNEGLLPSSHKTYSHVVSGTRGFSRPHSASSAESARPSRYMITGPNHPKVINRNNLPSTLEGDFLIHLPSTTNGGERVVDLSENSDFPTGTGGYYIGYPVVTDDEGGMTMTDDASPKQPQKNRVKRHRRTASTGSDSLKNFLSSGSSASESRPPHSNQSSTLPLSVTRQHIQPIRPGSADSMGRFEMHSPVTVGEGTDGQEPNDLISRYAKGVQEEIGEMISKHDNTEREEATPVINAPVAAAAPVKEQVKLPPTTVAATTTATKPRIWNHLGWISKGSGKQFGGGKGSGKDKGKVVHKTIEPVEAAGNNESRTQPLRTMDDNCINLSRIPSLASSVGRSDSFASTTSTNFSGVGGESSPYSTLSLDSLLIDTFDSMMLQPPYSYKRGMYTPIVVHHTSSSDEEGRPYSNRTLKRNPGVDKTSKTLPHMFQPVSIHHRAHSSCDSDQLQCDVMHQNSSNYGEVPLTRSESISISDMDRDMTDSEMHEKIKSLSKQLGKVRRSSTGSITICTHSGSSMEDIKGAD